MSKQKKLTKKSKHKEVINYSNRSAVENHTNTFGKVQKWLLESPIVSHPSTMNGACVGGGATHPIANAAITATTSATAAASTNFRKLMSKSQSTPERLGQRSPKKVKSVGNLNDKVKLQVVYKPPFKFSLKLSKNSAVKTKVIGSNNGGGGGIGGIGARNKRKLRAEPEKSSGDVNETFGASKSRRMALLIRTPATENSSNIAATTLAALDNNEPNYETLNIKKTGDGPVYENINVNSAAAASSHSSDPLSKKKEASPQPPPVNTATFRISRSVSGSNVIKPQISSNSTSTNSNNFKPVNIDHKGSTTNLSLSGGGGNGSGSTQNLIRSSTTNLSKNNNNNNRNSLDMKRGPYDLSRSSTTNLSKDKRNAAAGHHGSHANLSKHHRVESNSNLNIDDIIGLSTSTSSSSSSSAHHQQQPITNRNRKNSSTNLKTIDSSSKSNIPRIPSNSNLRRGSISNIPRASLNANSFNQHSRLSVAAAPNNSSNSKPQPQSLSQATAAQMKMLSNRPHTADCTTSNNISKRFEWPPVMMMAANTKTAKNEPLPSDLEVMVSDVENLVNDD